MLDITYNKAEWYAWVQSLQTEEDAKSETEKKKVKAEAALFKKHQMNVKKLREDEEEKHRSEHEKADVWDPIESIIEDSRAGYVALIKVFILAEGMNPEEINLAIERGLELKRSAGHKIDKLEMENLKRRRNRKALKIGPDRQKYKEAKKETREKRLAFNATVESDHESEGEGSTAELSNGITDLTIANGNLLSGPNEEAKEGLLEELKIISEFALLRFIIANPSLMTTAMASPSIEDFLNNTASVRNTDLRDLGLGLSRPSLKIMKSACLDF